MRLAGAVLCGGASRRMGRDKALIEVGGVAMAERVAGVLESVGCEPVVFIGGDARRLGGTRRRTHPDRWPGEGPAGGVITALGALAGEADAVVVAACDLVALTTDAVRRVVGTGPAGDVRVAEAGRLEPMLACWSPSALTTIERMFDAGTRAMHELIAVLDAERVVVDRGVLRNANTPGDLAD